MMPGRKAVSWTWAAGPAAVCAICGSRGRQVWGLDTVLRPQWRTEAPPVTGERPYLVADACAGLPAGCAGYDIV